KRPRRSNEPDPIMLQVLHEKQREDSLTSTLATLPKGAQLPVTVVELNKTYLPFVDRVNRRGLPIRYGADFYSSALQSSPWAKVALWDGCVVGAAICAVSEEIAGCIHVRSLVSDVKRRGVATQLLQAIFADAAAHGFRKSSLRVHVRNTGAIAFYESIGYQIKETLVEYYQGSRELLESPPDAHFMLREEGEPVPDSSAT
ncbi:unnamed protein product, partial [Polarella glacialis]